jgi:CBS domain-containing protein
MQLQGKALRVIIYIGEQDHYQGKPLYMALLQFLKREGAAGATVVRGLAGFGAHSRIHTATILDLSVDLPIRIEWVDQPEQVERLLPAVRQMVDDGLITVEELNVVQYAPGRQPDPLSQPVQDVMRTAVITVSPQTPAADVVTLLLQKGYRSLPVVDDRGRILGLITDGDLLRRAGLSTRLGLHTELPAAAWQEQLTSLRHQGLVAADLMSQPVITIPLTAPLRVATQLMVTHHLKRLPVVGPEEQLVGWISRIDILRTLEYHQPVAENQAEPLPQGTTIAELLYRDVPTVSPQARLDEILHALESNRRRRIVVVDEANRPVGLITDGDILQRSQQKAHPGLLARLRSLVTGQPAAANRTFADTTETAADLMTTPVITIGLEGIPAEALRLMVQHGIKRLPVVDESGRLVGLLGRSCLLRGLMQIDDSAEDVI